MLQPLFELPSRERNYQEIQFVQRLRVVSFESRRQHGEPAIDALRADAALRLRNCHLTYTRTTHCLTN